MIQDFLLFLIEKGTMAEMPWYVDPAIIALFLISNVLMFIPSLNCPVINETGEEWYDRLEKQRDQQKWLSLS